MDKQPVSIEELIASLQACVAGGSCEKCMECENLRNRFCRVKLMEKAASALEELQRKEKFHAFLWNTMPRSDLEFYISMYREKDEERSKWKKYGL